MVARSQVPGPKSLPVIGTAYSVNPNNLVKSQTELGDKYGEIFLHDLPGQPPLYIIGSHRLTHELCDQKRFHKAIHPSLEAIRTFAGNGLFTSYYDEPEWGQAHRILMPAFNPAALREMYEGMTDIAEQLMFKWARTRSDDPVDIPGDCTRLTLDTIALCSFSYRFNSFYSEKLHPFVAAMANGLKDSGKRSHMPDVLNKLNVPGTRRYDRDITTMKDTVDSLIAERKENPRTTENRDVLDVMLEAKDPKTGAKLSDENLRYQLITFLIAGHETTSGLLSFVVYELIKNPRVFKKAREIVDRVLGGRFPDYSDLKELGYLDQVLREGLRLYPTAPAFAVSSYEETVIGKDAKHEGVTVKPDDMLLVLLGRVHRDPDVWDSPEEFRPERFDFENAKDIPQHAWKPFGNGQRSCLGRAFALQEATMVLALMVQHFDFEFADPEYELDVIDGLTSKPKDLLVKVHNRPGHEFTGRRARRENEDRKEDLSLPLSDVQPNGHTIQIAVGSNAGTCLTFAKKLERFAFRQGYDVEVMDLDEAVDNLQCGDPVLIVTSSYEGLPPDNAAQFLEWLSVNDPDLTGVNYAVFGSGNSEWASTFQRVPTLVDELLNECGAYRLVERGAADVRGDHLGAFQDWSEELWNTVAENYDVDHHDYEREKLVLEGSTNRSHFLNAAKYGSGATDAQYVAAQVTDKAVLSSTNDDNGPIRTKMHLEVKLPGSVTFETGDYLEILPRNNPDLVERALKTFGLLGDDRVIVRSDHAFLPSNTPVTYREIFADYVNLSTIPTQRLISKLAEECPCPPEKSDIQELAGPLYQNEILDRRVSLLDLLEMYPSIRPDLTNFLENLEPLSPRKYSISSSSSRGNNTPAITFSVIDEPAWSGYGNFAGVASTYLANLEVGSKIQVRVVAGNPAFKPDKEPTAPAILIGAGTGIAPLRAFLQDLAANPVEAPRKPSEPKAVLYYGCHGEKSDFLYSDELRTLEEANIVDVRPAFSRHPVDGETGRIRYVQHRLWEDRNEVASLCERGAKVLVCGDARRLAPAVRQTFVSIVADTRGVSENEAATVVDKMQREKFSYVADVFE